MLCLGLNQGEYLTIGSDVVIQLDRITGDRCKLVIKAPREIPIVRGAVLERHGAERPDCVFDPPRYHKREIPWDRSKAQALAAMRALLRQMDGRDDDVKALRRQLNHMFPVEAKQATQASSG
ncbi:carbon storage regulator [Pseudoflavonifractor sp. 524-17]|uniref:carbon storage regulator n=1 Tax=Pseudoflavonifractor sp. 524-17 TaxID=2304577 RepID=UPI001379BD87|nr:carbon storage regulator [Pseudoflavonifractor sp. 524-17]NCE66398.1 carbon storage regulator [Pseudoflavonifractor sp. 524-17]